MRRRGTQYALFESVEAMPVEQQATVRRRLAVFVALTVVAGIALLVAAATIA